jgi:hypothetical protein
MEGEGVAKMDKLVLVACNPAHHTPAQDSVSFLDRVCAVLGKDDSPPCMVGPISVCTCWLADPELPTGGPVRAKPDGRSWTVATAAVAHVATAKVAPAGGPP